MTNKYINTTTLEIKSQGEWKQEHSNKSIPRVWSKKVCEDLGLAPILLAPSPATTDLERAYVSGTVQDVLGNWVQEWTVEPRFDNDSQIVDMLKARLHSELRSIYSAKVERPAVDTGLGFTIQGGYSDLVDFQVGHELGMYNVRDIDNVQHTVTEPQMANIVLDIKQNGMRLKTSHWAHKDSITAATTEAELRALDFTTGWGE